VTAGRPQTGSIGSSSSSVAIASLVVRGAGHIGPRDGCENGRPTCWRPWRSSSPAPVSSLRPSRSWLRAMTFRRGGPPAPDHDLRSRPLLDHLHLHDPDALRHV